MIVGERVKLSALDKGDSAKLEDGTRVLVIRRQLSTPTSSGVSIVGMRYSDYEFAAPPRCYVHDHDDPIVEYCGTEYCRHMVIVSPGDGSDTAPSQLLLRPRENWARAADFGVERFRAVMAFRPNPPDEKLRYALLGLLAWAEEHDCDLISQLSEAQRQFRQLPPRRARTKHTPIPCEADSHASREAKNP